MSSFTKKEAVLKVGKKVRTLIDLSKVHKDKVPQNSEGKVDAVTMNGDRVRVRFQITLYEWFYKHEYEMFLEEL